jgi:high-affinity iron transporter
MALAVACAQAGPVYPEGRRVVHMLEYILGDYPAALQSGSADEIAEQLAFLDEASTQVLALPEKPGRAAILESIKALRELISKKTPADKVAGALQEVINSFQASYPSGLKVPVAVSKENGEAVYKRACIACHGADGKAATPVALTLDPRPANFTDPEKMAKLSPMRAFNTTAFGVSRTSMPAFDQGLPEKDRWDVSFYLFTLRKQAVPAGTPQVAPPPLPELAAATDEALEQQIKVKGVAPEAAGAVRAMFRSQATYQNQEPPLARARKHLQKCQELLHKGRGNEAAIEALEAYLSGFEEVEPLLKVIQPVLALTIEQNMQRLPRVIRSGMRVDTIDADIDVLAGQLAEADACITDSQTGGPWIPLSAAFLILAREGLEAILVLAMLLAVLRKIDCADQARLVYHGAGAALLVGLIVWAGAQWAFQLAAAHRETSEAVISLLAAGLLYWAGLWMLSRLESQRWMGMIKNQLHGSISQGSRSGVMALSFLAVFREVVETVLFFQALLHQYPSHMLAIAEGALLGVLVLVVAAYLLFVLGLRLPLSAFFGASSIGMLLLSIVMVGQAGAALGEAGFFLPGTYPMIDSLGGPVGASHVLQILMALCFFITLLPHIRVTSEPPSGS